MGNAERIFGLIEPFARYLNACAELRYEVGAVVMLRRRFNAPTEHESSMSYGARVYTYTFYSTTVVACKISSEYEIIACTVTAHPFEKTDSGVWRMVMERPRCKYSLGTEEIRIALEDFQGSRSNYEGGSAS